MTSQLSSPLLSLLPREIRTQIWTYCVGYQEIHLDISAAIDRLMMIQALPRTRSAALLLVCRQIYNESLAPLYTTCVFHIPSTHALTTLIASLPRTTITLLRTLPMTYTLPVLPTTTDFYIINPLSLNPRPLAEIPDWKSMWRILDSLAGLKEVRLFLRVQDGQREGWGRREEEILDGLVEMKERKCVVVLPWEKGIRESRRSVEKLEEETYRGWKIERMVEGGRSVFTPFGVWDMQTDLERVWESQNMLFI